MGQLGHPLVLHQLIINPMEMGPNQRKNRGSEFPPLFWTRTISTPSANRGTPFFVPLSDQLCLLWSLHTWPWELPHAFNFIGRMAWQCPLTRCRWSLNQKFLPLHLISTSTGWSFLMRNAIADIKGFSGFLSPERPHHMKNTGYASTASKLWHKRIKLYIFLEQFLFISLFLRLNDFCILNLDDLLNLLVRVLIPERWQHGWGQKVIGRTK